MEPAASGTRMIRGQLIRYTESLINAISAELETKNLSDNRRNQLWVYSQIAGWIQDSAIKGDPELLGMLADDAPYLHTLNNPVNYIDLLGLLTESQCDTIRKMLDYEKEHGTKETADKFSNTWGTTKMGSEFDDQPIQTTQGILDLDWFTDLSSYRANPLTVDATYIVGKTIWNAARGKWVSPYADPKEAATANAIRSGNNKYSDLFPSAFMNQECPERCKK